jgi:hypothetical protein
MSAVHRPAPRPNRLASRAHVHSPSTCARSLEELTTRAPCDIPQLDAVVYRLPDHPTRQAREDCW